MHECGRLACTGGESSWHGTISLSHFFGSSMCLSLGSSSGESSRAIKLGVGHFVYFLITGTHFQGTGE